jgi:tRNA dimethylallyltransferase
MSGLGYRELSAFLAGETTLDDALAATRTATHDFIRRQMTWFRGHDRGIAWYDVDETTPERIATTVTSWLSELGEQ